MYEFKEDDIIKDELLKNEKEKVLSFLYFTASWCGPCKRVYPSLVDLSNKISEQEENNNIKFYKIDINVHEEFTEKCEIKAVPTFFIMNGVVKLGQCSGIDIETIGNLIVDKVKKYNSINDNIEN